MDEAILVSKELVKNYFPKRNPDSNKGTFGRSVVIGGSAKFVGAPQFANSSSIAILSALGKTSMRVGAGTSTICVPAFLAEKLYSFTLYSSICSLKTDGTNILYDEKQIDELISSSSAYAIGMGMDMSVGMGQHRNFLPLLGIVFQNLLYLQKLREIHILHSFFQAQRNGRIVDVLAGQPEVNKLLELLYFQLLEFLLDEVLDSLNIVVCNLFDILNLLRLLYSKILVNLSQRRELAFREALQLRKRDAAKGDEILDFHPDTVSYERILGEIIAEDFYFVVISPVYWGNGGKCLKHC